MLLPDDRDAVRTLALVQRAVAEVGDLDDLPHAVADGIARGLYGIDLASVPAATDDDLAAMEPRVRAHAVRLLAVLEFVQHPLPPAVADGIERFGRELDVAGELLTDARELAREHFAIVYFDLQRHGWYRHETIRESLRGRFGELLRSKLAYYGVVEDRAIAQRWQALRDCAPGTWGRGVADFYARHGFPFPGERNGIYELGARHDWVHVLAGYETTPEGEIDVFSFIAASMRDDRGLALLAFTLGLFQNGSIHRVGGKRLPNVRTDTLADPQAVERMVDALDRGRRCTADVMGEVDLFAHRDELLSDVRARFGVRPTALPVP